MVIRSRILIIGFILTHIIIFLLIAKPFSLFDDDDDDDDDAESEIQNMKLHDENESALVRLY